MYEDTTVAFSGHNIKWFAVLAIESFLLHYPGMRSNVVYFDDDSTDGTRAELEQRGIKIITWSPSIRGEFQALLDRGFFKDCTQTLSSRVCFIIKDIMEQVKTKYLLINDGDVVFKKGGFLENYFMWFGEGNRLVAHEEFSRFPKVYYEVTEGLKRYEYYKRFVVPSPFAEGFLCFPRVHMMHAMLDLEYFKSIDLLGDDLTPEFLEMNLGGFVDTGTDFYHKIADRNIPVKYLSSSEVYDILHHWSWISSANRCSGRENRNCFRNQTEEIRNALYKDGLYEIAREAGVHPMKLITSFENTKGKSRWS